MKRFAFRSRLAHSLRFLLLTSLIAPLLHNAIAQSELRSISISPSAATIASAQSQQFTVTGTFADGTSQDLTTVATYASSKPEVAVVNANGDQRIEPDETVLAFLQSTQAAPSSDSNFSEPLTPLPP